MPILFYIAMWSWALGVASCVGAPAGSEREHQNVIGMMIARVQGHRVEGAVPDAHHAVVEVGRVEPGARGGVGDGVAVFEATLI